MITRIESVPGEDDSLKFFGERTASLVLEGDVRVYVVGGQTETDHSVAVHTLLAVLNP